MAAQLEGEIVDLNTRVERDSKVKFLTSLIPKAEELSAESPFVLSYAVEKLSPVAG